MTCSSTSHLSQPYGRKGADYPLGIFLVGINLAILICDLLEVNQAFHYTSFALLGIAAAGKFVWLVVAHPKAVSGETRRKVLNWFGFGTVCILFAFAVSEEQMITKALADTKRLLVVICRSGTWRSESRMSQVLRE